MRIIGDLLIVCDQHDGPAFRMQSAEELHDVAGGLAVEIAGRFVGEDDARFVDEGPGDGHPLPLATGKLVGPVMSPVPHADLVEDLEDPVSRARLRISGISQGKQGIAADAEAGQEIEGLEDESDLVRTNHRSPVGADFPNFKLVENDGAVGRRIEKAEQMHESRLA